MDTPVRSIIKLYDLAAMDDGALVLAGTVDNMKAGAAGPLQRGWLIRVDSNGCMGPGDPQCAPVGIDELPAAAGLQWNWYPNPSDGLFYGTYTLQAPALLYITDLNGRLLHRQSFASGSGQCNIDARDWPPGIYLYRLHEAGGEAVTGKLIRL